MRYSYCRIEFDIAGNAALRALRPYPECGAAAAVPAADAAAPAPASATPALVAPVDPAATALLVHIAVAVERLSSDVAGFTALPLRHRRAFANCCRPMVSWSYARWRGASASMTRRTSRGNGLLDIPKVRAAVAGLQAAEFESDDDFGMAGNAALCALRPCPERGASVAAAAPAPTPVAESAAPALALAVVAPARGRRPRCNRAARAYRRRC
ncbi:hypothetical protein DL764_006016 [Monosporascus ibericus]|uniref:Uncharacterized protein n=1 Tax=Monosporascus ibericus TaxID=155417 RepID=A0A4Q4T692_9PEZI|nr:hypothetical protein DL764_006016 [Monosporascus ibericus]